MISAISRVELEAGVYRDRQETDVRRKRLDAMLMTLAILPFGDAQAEVYGRIIAVTGFSRTRILDRMIAAQAVVYGATLITMNGDDFSDIPGLTLEIW